MADALGPLPAFDGQAASAGLVAVHPAGCPRNGGRGQGGSEVRRGREGRWGGREGRLAREKARGEGGRGRPGARGGEGAVGRNRQRVRRGANVL